MVARGSLYPQTWPHSGRMQGFSLVSAVTFDFGTPVTEQAQCATVADSLVVINETQVYSLPHTSIHTSPSSLMESVPWHGKGIRGSV